MDRQSPIAPPSGDPPADIGAGRWKFLENEVLFGHYSLIREIGRGGMGLVLRARDAELGIDIALKLIPKSVLEEHGLD